ncbi:MAG TPA: peptide chain release factor N(5)-glutamine methyltransferase [Ktedonobacteraceae bacterium]|jgi:release factor glutamine methyltransferase
MATIRDLLSHGVSVLKEAGHESARLEAQLLLESVLGVDRAILYGYPERNVETTEEQHYRELIARRAQGEPVAYLTGHREFYGLDFQVDRRVLIPRPETELLVDAALSLLRSRLDEGASPVVADVATGSGIIPITLAVEEPRLTSLYATDISPDALAVARSNCELHQVQQRVHLLQGDLLTPLPEPVDLLTANLPYVGTDEIDLLSVDVYAYEPHLALFAGPEGLDLLQRLCQEARQSGMLKERGVLLLEIGFRQREPLERFLRELWPDATIFCKQDYAGWDRLMQVYTSTDV